MNKKVPFAILSCFLIAFVLQLALKMCGVFIFEKALSWDIFRIIDSNIILNTFYYSIFVFVAMYCCSFALSTKPYSTKIWHYIVLAGVSIGVTFVKNFTPLNITLQFIYDILCYILVPLLINLTLRKEDKIIISDKLTNVVVLVSMQTLMYFVYLGLCYWSSMACSLIPITQVVLYPSTMFLIYFEVYFGLALLMLCMNVVIKEAKNMHFPVNIGSDEAKAKELKEHKEKLENKKKK